MKNLNKTLNSLLSFNPELCKHFFKQQLSLFTESSIIFLFKVYLMTLSAPHTKQSKKYNDQQILTWMGNDVVEP